MIEINRNPAPRQLRHFGLVWIAFATLAAGYFVYRSGTWMPEAAWWSAAVAAASAGFLYPPWMRILHLGLSYAAFPIGWAVSHIILAIIYYLVVTPIGVVMRLAGRDPLERGFDREADSYWVKQEEDLPPSRYFRQF